MNKHYISLFTFLLLVFAFLLYPSVLIAGPTVELNPPADYAGWLPANGRTITFTVVVKRLNDPNDGFSQGTVTLTFEKVSKWPGICMNMNIPGDGSQLTQDLRFYPKDQQKLPSKHLTWDSALWNRLVGHESTSEDIAVKESVSVDFSSEPNFPEFSFPITIRCEDYGAFGILRATLRSTSPGKDYSTEHKKTIPQDDNGDYIADSWQPGAWDKVKKCHIPPSDLEEGPRPANAAEGTVEYNTQIGDGLCVFEEYRGFYVAGKFKRLIPTKKDIFIHSEFTKFDKKAKDGISKSGIGSAKGNLPSPFVIHEIRDDEAKDSEKYTEGEGDNERKKIRDRTVNFNSLGTPRDFGAGASWRVMPKWAIWIIKDSTNPAEVSGRSYGDGMITIWNVYINEKALALMGADGSKKRGYKRPDCPWNDLDSAEAGMLASTIGHEIGHAIGLAHPWECNVGIDAMGKKIGIVPPVTNSPYPNLNLAKTTKGWIGLYAFDNPSGTKPLAEIMRRYNAVYNEWLAQEKLAAAAGSRAIVFGDPDAEEKKKKAIKTYRTTDLTYLAAFRERNFYFTFPPDDPYGDKEGTIFRFKRLSHTGGRSPTGVGPFTYTYGSTIMDYDVRIYGTHQKVGGIYSADAYPAFHNWEYNLGVPQRNDLPEWTQRERDKTTTVGSNLQPPKRIQIIGRRTAPDTDNNDDDDDDGTGGDGTGGSGDGTGNGGNGRGDGTSGGNPVVPTPRVPSAPNRFSVRDGMNSSALLSWYTPSNSGSSAITGYKYSINSTITASGGGSWSSFKTLSFRKLSRGYHFSLLRDLTNGTTYGFKICAVSAAGDGAASSVVRVTPRAPLRRPDEPSSLSVRGEVRGAFLSWTAPSNPGNPALSGYKYRYTTVASPSATDWSAWTSTGNGTTTSVSVSGLRANVRYYFRVVAVNSVGNSTVSNRASATPLPPPEPPGAISSLSAVSGDRQVTLSWPIPSTFGTSPLSRYEYRVDVDNDDTWGLWGSTGSRVTSVIITGLTNGTTYGFQVRAVTAVGAGGASPKATATPEEPRVLPGAPVSLSAARRSSGAYLSWRAPSNVGAPALTGYKYRRTTVASPSSTDWSSWTSTGNGTTTSVLVRGLTNGTRYYFQVVAVNTAGNSPVSNKASVIPARPPGSPTSLSAESSGSGRVSLSWVAPSVNGGSAVAGYAYQYGSGSPLSWTSWRSTGNGVNTSVSVSGLTNGTAYSFRVRAINVAGSGSVSNVAKATPVAPVYPSGVRNLTTTAGNTQVSLSWDAPLTVGSGITDYSYQMDTGADGSWEDWVSIGSTDTSYTVTSLTNGTDYDFRVRAHNAAGAGSVADKVSETPVHVPGAPRTLRATAGNGQVTLRWLAPTDTGGGVVGYDYRIDTHNDSTWGSWTRFRNLTTAVSLTGLTNGTTYAFEVRARSSDGAGPASNKVVSTPNGPLPTDLPSAPRNLRASHSDGVVLLQWLVPSDDGSGIDGYQYYQSPYTPRPVWQSTRGGSRTFMRITGLTRGQTYTFKMRALSRAGSGPASNSISVTLPLPPRVPDAPTGVATTAGNTQISVSWTVPASDGGSAIADYEYRVDKDNDDRDWTAWASLKGTATSVTLTGLINNSVYGIQIRAVNSVGKGAASETVTETPVPTAPVLDPPGAPTGLTASLSNEYVYLSWTAPTDIGGSAISDYEVCWDSNNDGYYTLWKSTRDTNTSEYIINLARGKTYVFRVRARNDDGPGPASVGTSLVVPAATVPGAPLNLTVIGIDTKIVFGWTAPSSNGGSAITKYKYRHRVSRGTWSAYTEHTHSLQIANITGLTNETLYEVEVLAVNSVGDGPAASATARPTNKTKPGAPRSFDASGHNGLVELFWEAPSDNGNTPITDYEYKYRKSGGTWSSWTSTGVGAGTIYWNIYDVTGLTNDTSYDFDVRAVNAIGAGPGAGPLSATPTAGAPEAPTNLIASTGSATGTIDLSWTAPHDGGSPITHYEYVYCIDKEGWGQATYTSTGSSSTSYTVTGLKSGERYRFKVRAKNAVNAAARNGRSSRAARAYAR